MRQDLGEFRLVFTEDAMEPKFFKRHLSVLRSGSEPPWDIPIERRRVASAVYVL
jgi:hypothetical protein